MTQKEAVLTHLKSGNSITPDEAIKRFGVFRLGARIYDLKRDGHDIHVDHETVVNRYGHTSRFARYSLLGAAA